MPLFQRVQCLFVLPYYYDLSGCKMVRRPLVSDVNVNILHPCPTHPHISVVLSVLVAGKVCNRDCLQCAVDLAVAPSCD